MLGGGAAINGDATAGGTVSDPPQVTGLSTNGAALLSLPPVPACAPFSDGTGITGGIYDAVAGTLVMGGAGDNITLAFGTYCFSSVNLSSGNTLTITPPVTMFLTDVSDFSGGVLVNLGDPPDLLIYSSYAGVGEGLRVLGGAGAKAGVYAPKTGVKISGGAVFFGAAIGKSLLISGGGLVHYDEALGLINFWGVQLLAWREVS